jgi:hypothetical protein
MKVMLLLLTTATGTTWIKINFEAKKFRVNSLTKERCGLQFTCFSVAQKEIGMFFLDIG